MPPPVLTRRSALRLASGGGAAGLVGLVAHDTSTRGQSAAGGRDAALVTSEAQAAIDRGLAFLAQAQFADGGFSPDSVGGGAAVGVAALAGLALLAGGHHPGRGRYGLAVSRVVDYLLAAATGPTPGLLASAEAQRPVAVGPNPHAMYSHGFACLCLSEASGTLPDPARQRRVEAVLERAVAYTVRAQAADGGWRYGPQPPFSDVSVTAAQLMALRAARNAGLYVPKRVIDAGAEFLQSCQQPDGGFAYTRTGAASAFARSAAALVGLFSAGRYAGPPVERALRYLARFLPVRPLAAREVPPGYYFYGHYYAALAMWTAGGGRRGEWFPAARDDLLAKARTGVWTDPTYGPAYATAMSLIVLQLPNNYLPILQA